MKIDGSRHDVIFLGFKNDEINTTKIGGELKWEKGEKRHYGGRNPTEIRI